MKALVLFEDEGYENLSPLLFWRSIFELQIGRKIQLDRAAQCSGLPVAGVWTRDWLASVAAQRCCAPANAPVAAETVLVNGRWVFDQGTSFPRGPCVGLIDGEVAFIACGAKLASQLEPEDLLDPVRRQEKLEGVKQVSAKGRLIHYAWDVIGILDDLLASDWRPEEASIDAELDSRATVGPLDQIHIGQRTEVHPTAIIDATGGPIYISHDVVIGAHAIIEGPAYIGPGTTINPRAWIHGGNAIGPVCKIGGEVQRCVIHGYTNKQHEGFLGHAYVGSWVNLGAGCTNSDLKNTYGRVRVPINGIDIDTGQTVFGAIIGDHAKIGINAAIPSGAVIGFAAMVASTRVLPKSVSSFAWVTDDGVRTGDPGRMLDAATAMMARRGIDMTDDEVELFLELGPRAQAIEERRSLRPVHR